MKRLLISCAVLFPSLAFAEAPSLTISSCDTNNLTYSFSADTDTVLFCSNAQNWPAENVVVYSILNSETSGNNINYNFAADLGLDTNVGLFCRLVDFNGLSSEDRC